MRPTLHENLADLLLLTCRGFPDRPAVVRGEQAVSYAELADRSARLAAFLHERGIRSGDRIGIALRNSPEYVETIVAACWLGALPFNVNYKYKADELVHVLRDAGAVALVHDQAVGELLAGRADAVHDVRLWIAALDASAAAVDASVWTYQDAVRGMPIVQAPPTEEGDWLLYTGGTTGLPKGVRSKHGDLIDTLGRRAFDYLDVPTPPDRAAFERLIDDLGGRPGQHVVNLVAPPAMHATGTYATLGTLLTGGTVVYQSSDSFDPADMAGLIERHGVTHLTIVGDAFARPLVAELRRARSDGTPYDLTSLQCVHSVGAAWSVPSKSSLLEFCSAEIEDILASTETGRYAAMVTSREEDGVRTVLRPFPGVRVVDDDGADVVAGSGVVGHLAAPVSDSIGYANGSGDTSFRLIDGRRYCLPGDLAVVTDDGSLELRGRSNRAINTGGEKVFAEEVEGVLLDHPALVDAVVVGRPDEIWGSAVVALVVAERGAAAPTEVDIREFVHDRLANYKCPKQVRIIEEIARLASGKIDLRWAESFDWSEESQSSGGRCG